MEFGFFFKMKIRHKKFHLETDEKIHRTKDKINFRDME